MQFLTIELGGSYAPNPPLNSDPACIVFRSFSSPCFLGSAQRLGAGGAGSLPSIGIRNPMITNCVYATFLGWAILSSVGLLLIVLPGFSAALRKPLSPRSLIQFFVTFFHWWLWCLGFSLLFLACLFPGSLMDRAWVSAITVPGYMALGYLIGKLRGVSTRQHLISMMGLPPLQAAVIIANRKVCEGE